MKTGTTITAIAALSMLAGTAAADVINPSRGLDINGKVVGSVTDLGEGVKTLDVGGVDHVNVQGSSFSRVIELNVGAGDLGVGGIGWDLWADTPNPEYLETARISIVDSDGNGVTFAPFKFTLDERGDQGEAYHSEGWIDISDLRLGFPIRDGEIQIEFHLTDNPIAGPEVTYLDGSTLSVEVVPAPGTAALLGMGGLAVARRRRR